MKVAKAFLNAGSVNIILILAFILRFYSLASTNFYPDESVYYFAARWLIEDEISAWYTNSWQPPMSTWINYLFVSLFGLNELGMRISSVVFGTLTVLVVYFLARLWFNKKIALISALIMAILPLHVIYSRLAFTDVMQTFFLLLSISLAEYYLKKSYKPVLYLSGIAFAISFLIKYNALVVWGLYWIIVLIYAFIKARNKFKRCLSDAFISNLAFAIATLAVILLSGGIPMLIYAVNNFAFLVVLQSQEFTNPFYYHLLVLIEYSPLLFVLFFASIFYFLFKEKSREEWVIWALVVVFFAIATLQQRRLSRHQLLILPFTVLLMSRFLAILILNFYLGKKAKVLLIAILATSATAWGILEIDKIKNMTVMRDIGSYIKDNYPDSFVHTFYAKQIAYYGEMPIGKAVGGSRNISSLKKDDIFVYQVSKETKLENSPYEDNLPFLRKETTEYWRFYSPKLLEYVRNNGQIIKEFKYKDGTHVILYQIIKTDLNVKDESLPKSSQDQPTIFYKFACKMYEESVIKNIIIRLLSKEQIEALNRKC